MGNPPGDGIPSLSGRSPGEGNSHSPSNLAWRIPWTKKPDGLPSMGPKELDTTGQLTHDWDRRFLVTISHSQLQFVI